MDKSIVAFVVAAVCSALAAVCWVLAAYWASR